MLAGARKGTHNSHFCAVCLSLLDGTQTTKVTNRTRHRGRSLSSTTSAVGFTFSFSKPLLQCLIWRFRVGDIDIYTRLAEQGCYAHRKSKWKERGGKGKNKGRIRMRPYAKHPSKLRTRLERKGNWTKLQRVHISLSRLLALRHRQHLSSRPCC